MLTLAALILAAGSLSDRYGRRRVFILGVVVFVAAVRRVPETRDPTRAGGFDLPGAALAMLAFAGGCFALIQASGRADPSGDCRGGRPGRRRRCGAAQRPPDASTGTVPLSPVRQRHLSMGWP